MSTHILLLTKLAHKPNSAACIQTSVRGLAFSSEGGSQIYKKSASIKLPPPYFGNQNLMTPLSLIHLTPKQAKIVLKSVFFEQNKHTICGHLVTPYILVIKKFMTPLFSFPKIYDPPQYIWDPPPSKENASPQNNM